MIKGIIFDLGNVLCAVNNQFLVDRIAQKSGKDSEQIFNIIYKESRLPTEYELGNISSQEFHKQLMALCEFSASLEEMKQIYSKDKLSIINGMPEIVERLQKSYRIGLLTNTSEWDYEYASKLMPFLESFHAKSKSYEIKAMKPSPKIYQVTLNSLQLQPHECIYVDDVVEYVNAAISLRIDGIHFTGKDTFIRELEKRNIFTS